MPASKNYFKDNFNRLPNFQSPITDYHIKNLVECCTFFETKNDHNQALNTAMLGVTPIYFTQTDLSLFYSIFQINPKEVMSIIKNCPVTNNDWVIVNDVYNQMVVYLSYRILNEKSLSDKQKHTGLFTLFKLLHYKFFTSIIYHSYKFGADPDTMQYVIANLSNKFDIVKLGTWKAVLEQRATDIVTKGSLHYDTLLKYENDEDIIYVISDTQSRLRQKLVLINRLYYEAKEKKEAVSGYKLVDEIDGQKIIQATGNSFDNIISNLQMQVQSPSRFLDIEIINAIASKFRDLSPEMFKTILVMFCDQASNQAEHKLKDSIIKVKNNNTGEKEDVIVSIKLLIQELIQKTYRYCIMTKTNMYSKADILTKIINTYTSSRVSDQDILKIKRSFVYFVINCKKTVRNTTIASLSLGIIVYIMIKSFHYFNQK